MTAWNYPIVIVLSVVAALFVTAWLIRLAAPRSSKIPEFECLVCGRKQRGSWVDGWRYCPYCGVPRDSRRFADLDRAL